MILIQPSNEVLIQGSFLAAALGRQATMNPYEHFSRRHGRQTCMIGNGTYIEGGIAYMFGSSKPGTKDSIVILSKSLFVLRLPVSINIYRTLDDQSGHLRYG